MAVRRVPPRYPDRPHWRQGLAVEAATAVRALATAWGYRYVSSLIRPQNRASRDVATKLRRRVARATTFHGHHHLVYRVAGDDPAISAGAR